LFFNAFAFYIRNKDLRVTQLTAFQQVLFLQETIYDLEKNIGASG